MDTPQYTPLPPLPRINIYIPHHTSYSSNALAIATQEITAIPIHTHTHSNSNINTKHINRVIVLTKRKDTVEREISPFVECHKRYLDIVKARMSKGEGLAKAQQTEQPSDNAPSESSPDKGKPKFTNLEMLWKVCADKEEVVHTIKEWTRDHKDSPPLPIVLINEYGVMSNTELDLLMGTFGDFIDTRGTPMTSLKRDRDGTPLARDTSTELYRVCFRLINISERFQAPLHSNQPVLYSNPEHCFDEKGMLRHVVQREALSLNDLRMNKVDMTEASPLKVWATKWIWGVSELQAAKYQEEFKYCYDLAGWFGLGWFAAKIKHPEGCNMTAAAPYLLPQFSRSDSDELFDSNVTAVVHTRLAKWCLTDYRNWSNLPGPVIVWSDISPNTQFTSPPRVYGAPLIDAIPLAYLSDISFVLSNTSLFLEEAKITTYYSKCKQFAIPLKWQSGAASQHLPQVIENSLVENMFSHLSPDLVEFRLEAPAQWMSRYLQTDSGETQYTPHIRIRKASTYPNQNLSSSEINSAQPLHSFDMPVQNLNLYKFRYYPVRDTRTTERIGIITKQYWYPSDVPVQFPMPDHARLPNFVVSASKTVYATGAQIKAILRWTETCLQRRNYIGTRFRVLPLDLEDCPQWGLLEQENFGKYDSSLGIPMHELVLWNQCTSKVWIANTHSNKLAPLKPYSLPGSATKSASQPELRHLVIVPASLTLYNLLQFVPAFLRAHDKRQLLFRYNHKYLHGALDLPQLEAIFGANVVNTHLEQLGRVFFKLASVSFLFWNFPHGTPNELAKLKDDLYGKLGSQGEGFGLHYIYSNQSLQDFIDRKKTEHKRIDKGQQLAAAEGQVTTWLMRTLGMLLSNDDEGVKAWRFIRHFPWFKMMDQHHTMRWSPARINTASDDSSLRTALNELQATLKVHFKDINILLEALTLRGAAGLFDPEPRHYHRLEHLGDAVLEYAAASWLYQNCISRSTNELSELRRCAVANETLSRHSMDLGLPDYMINPPGDRISDILACINIRKQVAEPRTLIAEWLLEESAASLAGTPPKTLANLLESLLGAMFVDRCTESLTQVMPPIVNLLLPIFSQVSSLKGGLLDSHARLRHDCKRHRLDVHFRQHKLRPEKGMKPLIMIVITIQDREIGRATHLEMSAALRMASSAAMASLQFHHYDLTRFPTATNLIPRGSHQMTHGVVSQIDVDKQTERMHVIDTPGTESLVDSGTATPRMRKVRNEGSSVPPIVLPDAAISPVIIDDLTPTVGQNQDQSSPHNGPDANSPRQSHLVLDPWIDQRDENTENQGSVISLGVTDNRIKGPSPILPLADPAASLTNEAEECRAKSSSKAPSPAIIDVLPSPTQLTEPERGQTKQPPTTSPKALCTLTVAIPKTLQDANATHVTHHGQITAPLSDDDSHQERSNDITVPAPSADLRNPPVTVATETMLPPQLATPPAKIATQEVPINNSSNKEAPKANHPRVELMSSPTRLPPIMAAISVNNASVKSRLTPNYPQLDEFPISPLMPALHASHLPLLTRLSPDKEEGEVTDDDHT